MKVAPLFITTQIIIFSFDSEPNGIPLGSQSNGNWHNDHIPFNLIGKLSSRSYPIQCEKKWKYSFLSVVLKIQQSLESERDCLLLASWGPIRGSPETPLSDHHSTLYRIEGFQGGLNLGPLYANYNFSYNFSTPCDGAKNSQANNFPFNQRNWSVFNY